MANYTSDKMHRVMHISKEIIALIICFFEGTYYIIYIYL